MRFSDVQDVQLGARGSDFVNTWVDVHCDVNGQALVVYVRSRGSRSARRPLLTECQRSPSPTPSLNPRAGAGSALRIELVFDRRDPGRSSGRARASTPGCRAAATARCAATASAWCRRRVRRDPHAAATSRCPSGSATLQAELDALVAEFAPVGARGRAGAVPGERPHRDVGRPGERARARGGRRRRASRSCTTAPTR